MNAYAMLHRISGAAELLRRDERASGSTSGSPVSRPTVAAAKSLTKQLERAVSA